SARNRTLLAIQLIIGVDSEIYRTKACAVTVRRGKVQSVQIQDAEIGLASIKNGINTLRLRCTRGICNDIRNGEELIDLSLCGMDRDECAEICPEIHLVGKWGD